MLVGQLTNDSKAIFLSIASKSDFDIEVMETDDDHVHCLIRYIPRRSIAKIVRRPKQRATSQIRQLHHTTLRRQYWYQSILWSDGYFVCSVGGASPDTIRNHILSRLTFLSDCCLHPIHVPMDGMYPPFYKSHL